MDEFKQFILHVLDMLHGITFMENGESLKDLFLRFDSNHDGSLNWNEAWRAMEPIHAKLTAESMSWEMSFTMSCDEFKAMIK
jgi:Ca2+-binding EF-hand superfamily protein